MCRPSTKPVCPASTPAASRACSRPRARRQRSWTSWPMPSSRRLRNPRCASGWPRRARTGGPWNPTGLSPKLLKRGLAKGKKQPGLWLSLESPHVTEVLAGAGYDWLLLDMEHTCLDTSQGADHPRAAKGGTAELVVRIPWNEPVIVKRLLDAGVRSIMVPFVQGADEARRAVAATRYPPHGIRGVSGNMRANGFSRIKDYGQRYHEEQCIIVQIESPTAVAAIAEIGAVDGVDGIFVGPNDLAANMGLYGQPGAPEVR